MYIEGAEAAEAAEAAEGLNHPGGFQPGDALSFNAGIELTKKRVWCVPVKLQSE